MSGLSDLTRDFAKRFNVTQPDARKCIEFICEDIADRLGKGESVNLRHFGVFKTADVGARTIRNLQTGEPKELAPTVRFCFTASDHLKKRVLVERGLMTAEEAGITLTEATEEAVEQEAPAEEA